MKDSFSSTASALAATPTRLGLARFGHEMCLLAGLLVLMFGVAAMVSHSLLDPAWSTSGASDTVVLHNWMGRLGALLADAAYFGFGFSVWWLWAVAVFVWLRSFWRWITGAGMLIPTLGQRLQFWLGLLVLLGAGCALEWSRLYRFEDALPGHAGGVLGYMLGVGGMRWLGFTGSGVVGILAMVAALGWVFDFSWGALAQKIGTGLDTLWLKLQARREQVRDTAQGKQAARQRAQDVQHDSPAHHDPVVIAPPPQAVAPSERVFKERQQPLFKDAPAMPTEGLPQVDLLDAAPAHQESVAPETLEMTSRLIEKKLRDFGVDVVVVQATPGPVVTRYEIEPATGVKGAQVVNLAKDLARSLSLVSIRVIETIPGKTTMALELPNVRRQTIRLSEVLGSQIYHQAKSLLTMGLGKDIEGKPVVADLAKMPHVLVAGTTGSGKSVGINAMILSVLYKAEAKDVRLLMIDPKMLEMSVYEGIPHLLAPVVTDMKQAANGLNWCVAEMEKRYKLMSKLGVRNLAGYNAKIDEAHAREESIGNPFSLTPEQPEPLQRLPHIVIVIDELADLMMVVGKKIEELIARLAQKARAAGIHLILATQRPSVDVITGLIKANIPTRIAFQVSSKIDSRTVLDQMGAESLLGMGDMLYMASGTGLPVRVHGAFVSDEEVHRVVAYLKQQGEPDYIDGVLDAGGGDDGLGGDPGEGGAGSGEQDAMYDQAVQVVLQDRKASISYVQRKLGIGYNRSANLLEQMERAGLVSALTASGKREVLVPARPE
ncbi:DNA translocase FtsK [Comamonas nitrativorans]|uniref:DNA translocase FtsK n=1 Tax=Comamonas nitrativorans TaxID=108437 RepID=A0ABV9GSA9_9BURK